MPRASERSAPRKAAASTRASRSNPKSAATRERILDAGASILARYGYAGARLEDVAEIAGVAAPAIYYYFRSRESLIEEVMQLGASRAHEHVRSALDALPSAATPLERIEAAIRAHLEALFELSDYAAANIRNSGQLPEQIRKRQYEQEKLYGALWQKLLEAARTSGEVRTDFDPYLTKMLVLGSLNWTPEWVDVKTTKLEELVRQAQNLILSGIRA
jgi:AcrR family transcriptional regulator